MKAILAMMTVLGMGMTASAACNNGDTLYVPVQGNGDSYSYSAVTCKGGRFFEKAAPVKATPCKAGDVLYVTEENPVNDSQILRAVSCKNGRFAPKAAPVKVTKCKDGQTYQKPVGMNGNQQIFQTWTCSNGKFRP